jgi:hypothetical protein
LNNKTKQKGLAVIEAISILGIFLLFVSITLNSLNFQKNLGEKASNHLKAKSNSLFCSSLIDSFYSNQGSISKKIELNCFIESEKIKSIEENELAESSVIPKNVKTIQEGENTVIRVKLAKHYGE